MKKFAIIAAGAAALTSTPAFAQAADNQAQGSALAEVIAPITVTHPTGAALNFGQFAAGTGGSVTVAQNDARTSATVNLAGGTTPSADRFNVSGGAGRAFSITTSTANSVTHNTDNTTKMAFTVNAPVSGTLDATAGTATFKVGGTLTVAANQKPGGYTGSYTVQVAYN